MAEAEAKKVQVAPEEVAEAGAKKVQVAPKVKNKMNPPAPVVEAVTSNSTVRAAEKTAAWK